jgi:hypothetical protein
MSRSRLLLQGGIMTAGGVMLAACGIVLTVVPSSAPAFASILMLAFGAVGLIAGVALIATGARTPR